MGLKRTLGKVTSTARFAFSSHRGEVSASSLLGTGVLQVRRYLRMTNPLNMAIYAFGGFMLFALAIGFFAAPV
jgi:hypothetical protein